MAFKVGDSVRVLPDAAASSEYLDRVLPIAEVDEEDSVCPYKIANPDEPGDYQWFYPHEVEAPTETPTAQTHDYMLGYADAYNFPGGAEDVKYHPNAEYRAGFVAGWERFSADCNQEMRHNLFGD